MTGYDGGIIGGVDTESQFKPPYTRVGSQPAKERQALLVAANPRINVVSEFAGPTALTMSVVGHRDALDAGLHCLGLQLYNASTYITF
jgi:hypothetical protein